MAKQTICGEKPDTPELIALERDYFRGLWADEVRRNCELMARCEHMQLPGDPREGEQRCV